MGNIKNQVEALKTAIKVCRQNNVPDELIEALADIYAEHYSWEHQRPDEYYQN
jgi:hypothetical protein